MTETLEEIIAKLWTTPERAEWVPKTDTIALSDLQRWMASSDIEILGFASHLISDRRFRIEPPVSLDDYVAFVKRYCERCLRENPDGKWSDSNYSAGGDLVNIFAALWRDSSVPRDVLADLINWLAQLYKCGNAELRTCIVNATLEHLFEQKELREFFSGWQKDPILAVAYLEACEWYKGGGMSPLGRPRSGQK